MSLTRRAALTLIAVAPFSGAPADAWPHPEIGRIPNRETLVSGMAYVGCWIEDGNVLDPGRVYTLEEWEKVRGDVEPFLRRRNERHPL